jgi:hypothetical protein
LAKSVRDPQHWEESEMNKPEYPEDEPYSWEKGDPELPLLLDPTFWIVVTGFCVWMWR